MDEPLALLLLPVALEEFALAEQARDLLTIPRVIALEPPRLRTPRFMREGAVARQAARMRLSGRLRVLILYHPAQYPLARALVGRYPDAELWYLAPGSVEPTADNAEEEQTFDALIRERAAGVLEAGEEVDDSPLRERLHELAIISPHAFVAKAHFTRFRRRQGND